MWYINQRFLHLSREVYSMDLSFNITSWLSVTTPMQQTTYHVDLQVDGETDVVRYIILSHVHNVVHLVGNLLRSFLFINNYTASLQNTAK